jgi:glycerol-3-phosphate dehydrogenase
MLGAAKNMDDLGKNFGATLTEAELRWMRDREYARTGEDALWRRSKLGLHMSAHQRAAVEAWFAG